MANVSYIPAPDSLFALWLSNFAALLTATPATYGLLAGDAIIVAAQESSFATAYALAVNPLTRTSATIADKDAARASAESVVRPYAQRIRVNPAVSNLDRVAIGLTVAVFPPTPIPAPTTSPVLMLVGATPLQHTLQYRDASTPTTKSKPYGVRQLTLFRSVGLVAATDPAQCSYVGGYTKSPLQVGFDAPDRGKLCTYFGRWENGSGPGGTAAVGPWSNPITVGII